MSRRLSALSAAALLSASLPCYAEAPPSLQGVSQGVVSAVRGKTGETLMCDHVDPYSETVSIVIEKPLSILSGESVILPFLALYSTDPDLRQKARRAYQLLLVTRDFFEPVLSQMKEKFGQHANWTTYEAKVRSQFEDVDAMMLKIQSGQVTADELASYTYSRGGFGLVIRMLTGGAARECFGVSKTSVMYRAKVVRD